MEVTRDEIRMLISVADWAIMNGYRESSDEFELLKKLIRHASLESNLKEHFKECYGIE